MLPSTFDISNAEIHRMWPRKSLSRNSFDAGGGRGFCVHNTRLACFTRAEENCNRRREVFEKLPSSHDDGIVIIRHIREPSKALADGTIAKRSELYTVTSPAENRYPGKSMSVICRLTMASPGAGLAGGLRAGAVREDNRRREAISTGTSSAGRDLPEG